MIHIKNLTKKYPIRGKRSSWKTGLAEALMFREKEYLTALDNVSLHIRMGEILGILGPNGAGKTTLLKVIAGFLLPDSGSVSVNGYDIIKNRHEVRTSCNFLRAGGWVIFDYKYPINKLLMFWGVFLGLGLNESKKRVDYVLESVGLMDKKKEYVENLSFGMRQKLNLARCLMVPRPIYLMDEPTTNIDPYSANFIRGFIKNKLTADATTVVLATHNLWEAEMICDRVIILYEGKVLMIGSSEEIKNRIASETAILKLDSISKDVLNRISSLNFVVDVVRKDDFIKIYGREMRKNLPVILKICENSKITYVDVIEPSLNEIFIQLMEKKDAE